jgi:Fe-S oxidoreductase
VRKASNQVLGLAPQRTLPKFAPSLYRWFARHQRPSAVAATATVVLFADCFVTYNEPQIGQDAVRVLEALGYRVELPRVGCCGRAMISTGLLPDAIRSADAVLASLRPFIEDDRVKAIVVCEPSCLSAMKDDWLQLKLQTDMDLRKRLAAKAMLVEEFIERFWDQHPIRPQVKGDGSSEVVLHGHCHQKALWGEQTSSAILKRLVGERLKVLPSGCCGMAGGFGYTADKYEVSMKVGEQSLFGLLRDVSEDAVVLAPGTSCRHQIKDGTKRAALHPIELIARVLLNEQV